MKLGWRLVLVALAVATGGYLSRRPWMVYQEQQRKADEATRAMLEAERQRELLVREKAQLTNSVGKEELMRRKGFRRPGEQPNQ